MPSAPLNPSMLPLTTVQPLRVSVKDISLDSESTLKKVKEILFKFLENSSELGTKANDIERRLGVMEDMWLSGKLNNRIHMQMMELACG